MSHVAPSVEHNNNGLTDVRISDHESSSKVGLQSFRGSPHQNVKKKGAKYSNFTKDVLISRKQY